MRVCTFHCGLANGLPFALKKLDEKTAELGNVTIQSVQDTLYRDTCVVEGGPPTEQVMVRVVIYATK